MPLATLLFIAVPLIEMVILIQVGGMIGVLPTVLLVILTAVAGIWLLRAQGIATMARVQQKLERGELPETELLEGVMLIIGGALLLTPGFATDFLGFVCLLPGLRRPLASRIIASATFRQFGTGSPFNAGQRRPGDNGDVIDGEFSEESDAPESRDDRDRPG